jgi:hypothetical protein
MNNGNTVNFLVWIVTGLIGIIEILVGFIVHLHVKSDDERWRDHEKITNERRLRIEAELGMLRGRIHDLSNRFSEINTRLRWVDEDKSK